MSLSRLICHVKVEKLELERSGDSDDLEGARRVLYLAVSKDEDGMVRLWLSHLFFSFFITVGHTDVLATALSGELDRSSARFQLPAALEASRDTATIILAVILHGRGQSPCRPQACWCAPMKSRMFRNVLLGYAHVSEPIELADARHTTVTMKANPNRVGEDEKDEVNLNVFVKPALIGSQVLIDAK